MAFVGPSGDALCRHAGILGARTILKGWRIAIIAVVTFTAFATPATDIVSMFLLAVPMLVLYFAAAGVAALNDRRRAKRQAAFLAEEGLDDDLDDDLAPAE